MPTSVTKQTLTLETAARLLGTFSDRPLVALRELGDGYFNSAYLLECAGDQKVVLKIAPSPLVPVLRQEQGLMQIEVETMRYVAAHTSLPVPRILTHCTDSPHIDSPYMAMEYIDGVPLDKLLGGFTAEKKAHVFQALGRSTAELHTLATPRFGAPTHGQDTWSAAFCEMIQDVLLDAEDVEADLGVPPQALQGMVRSYAGVLDEVRVPTLLHRDLWFGNIFVDPATLAIVGITDWERSVSGDPLMEFVCALVEGLYAPEGNAAFSAGYGRSRDYGETERIRMDLYSMYLALLLVVEGYFRQYRSTAQEAQIHTALQGLVASLKGRVPR